jgi:hypothetical protein
LHGVIRNAINKATSDKNIFDYGISDKEVGGLDIQKPDVNLPLDFAAALLENIPEPFL